MDLAFAGDPFAKIKKLIQELIERLLQEAANEANQKGWCDKAMADAKQKRTYAADEIEGLNAKMAKLEALSAKLGEELATLAKEIKELKASQAEAKKAQTEAEIQALTEAIAELQKALLEATELRSQERAENEKTIADATSGKSAVEFALQVLQEFYEGAVALQVSYVPPNSDREGKTVGDLAPEVFSVKYSGRQDASKGILGMLEVILSDFERTIETVTAEEEAAQADFETFEANTKADIKAKDTEKKEKEAEVAALTDKIAELTDELKDAEEKKKEALAELEKLKPMCVEAEETYAERVAKREAEIEALKQAMEILENWQA